MGRVAETRASRYPPKDEMCSGYPDGQYRDPQDHGAGHYTEDLQGPYFEIHKYE